MASVSVVAAYGLRDPGGHTVGVDRLPQEMNDMKIRDDKVTDTSCFWLLTSPLSFLLDYLLGVVTRKLLNVHRKRMRLLLTVMGQRQVT